MSGPAAGVAFFPGSHPQAAEAGSVAGLVAERGAEAARRDGGGPHSWPGGGLQEPHLTMDVSRRRVRREELVVRRVSEFLEGPGPRE